MCDEIRLIILNNRAIGYLAYRCMIESMKKRIAARKYNTMAFAVVLITGVILIVALVKLWDGAKPTDSKNDSQTKNQAPLSQKDDKQFVHIPGTNPITRINGDPTKPDSLWTVVSKDYPLTDKHYKPADLELMAVPTREDKTVEERSVRSLIQKPLADMFDAAKHEGFDLMVASGFRSYELQQTYFTSYSQTYGEAEATKFSARPGESEHQTGLAVDISLVSRECYLDVCFGEKPAGKWLAAHAYEYGFTLRYPADKTNITQYQYEPWHFRFVGKDLARALHDSGLTLDEARPYLVKTN